MGSFSGGFNFEKLFSINELDDFQENHTLGELV
jgi:hypothetical protein